MRRPSQKWQSDDLIRIQNVRQGLIVRKTNFHRERLMKCIQTYILDDKGMFQNSIDDVRRRIQKIFADCDFSKAVENSGKDNWLRAKASVAFERILECLEVLR